MKKGPIARVEGALGLSQRGCELNPSSFSFVEAVEPGSATLTTGCALLPHQFDQTIVAIAPSGLCGPITTGDAMQRNSVVRTGSGSPLVLKTCTFGRPLREHALPLALPKEIVLRIVPPAPCQEPLAVS